MLDWRLDARGKRKYAAAEKLGLTEELLQKGWAGLSAKDAGRIGGTLRGKNRKNRQPAEPGADVQGNRK